jgi:hypothetical protein
MRKTTQSLQPVVTAVTFPPLTHYVFLKKRPQSLADRTSRSGHAALLQARTFLYFSFQCRPVMHQPISQWVLPYNSLRKATVCSVLSVCLSAWNNSAHWTDFMKLDIWGHFKFCRENSSLLKSHKNNAYFTWRKAYIYDRISRNSS